MGICECVLVFGGILSFGKNNFIGWWIFLSFFCGVFVFNFLSGLVN